MQLLSAIVIVKLPQDAPRTDEPIVYSFIRLQPATLVTIRSATLLHLKDASEIIDGLLNNTTSFTQLITVESVMASMKSLSYYRKTAKHIWGAFDKQPDEMVDFPTILRMLDRLDMFLLEAQAARFMKAVDLRKLGSIGVSEFENILIAYHVLGHIL